MIPWHTDCPRQQLRQSEKLHFSRFYAVCIKNSQFSKMLIFYTGDLQKPCQKKSNPAKMSAKNCRSVKNPLEKIGILQKPWEKKSHLSKNVYKKCHLYRNYTAENPSTGRGVGRRDFAQN